MLTDEIKAVILSLPDEAYSADGKPKVKDLEDAYAEAYPDADKMDLSAADRDALWIEFQVAMQDGAPDGMLAEPMGRSITLTASPANPLKVIVNGRTLAVLQIGEPANIDPVAFAHMMSIPGVTYTEGQF